MREASEARELNWRGVGGIALRRVGFMPVDFEVFQVQDFSERMQQIYALIRPKLLRLGDELAPQLAHKLQMEFFPHVARHQRHTVNPPSETWVAFGPSPRGYKRHGYLALCVSAAGLHVRCVVKPEADNRRSMSASLKARASDLATHFLGTRLARYDNWDFVRLPIGQSVDRDLFAITLADGLAKKTGGIDVGFGWALKDALHLDRAELIDAFRELEPLYRALHITT
jgi:uncharacterized protein YktB (UPF0637 family)